MRIVLMSLGVAFFLLSTSPAYSQGGVPISTAPDSQFVPVIISDDAGGAIIAWQDQRSGHWDIYAQRVDAAGVVQWTPNGTAISMAADRQFSPAIASDMAGGAIVTWFDLRINPDIYAQRIDATGAVQWTPDGVPISTNPNVQEQPKIVSDGSGGAIIAWQDQRSGHWDIYAQRISDAGVVQWTPDGVPISTEANDQTRPTIVSDGAGGAIIAWEDKRSGNDTEDTFAQRIDASGIVQWTTEGLPITTTPNPQEELTIASDGAGGAIITWQDKQSGIWDIYAERVDAAGMVHWFPTGIEDPGMTFPESYLLHQNVPNPFNPCTAIRYQIADSRHPVHTILKVYNTLGQEVRTLVDELQEPGYYTTTWDGTNSNGREVTSGVYFFKLSVNNGQWSEMKKVVLIK